MKTRLFLFAMLFLLFSCKADTDTGITLEPGESMIIHLELPAEMVRVGDLPVVVEKPPNTEIREYHVRFEPSECMLRMVGEIIGVTEARNGNKYSIWVVKAPAFTWDEIEPGILEILKGDGCD